MRIYLAANFQGYATARQLEQLLSNGGHEVVWMGAAEYDDNDDYPAISMRVAQAVIADEDTGKLSRGIVVGGDVMGETMATNKVNGARAVPALSTEAVVAARLHSNANVLLLPSEWLSVDDMHHLVNTFIATDFSMSLDDIRRLVNIAEYENSGTIEGWMLDADHREKEIPADPSNTGKFERERSERNS